MNDGPYIIRRPRPGEPTAITKQMSGAGPGITMSCALPPYSAAAAGTATSPGFFGRSRT
jgi:hypothetical protein